MKMFVHRHAAMTSAGRGLSRPVLLLAMVVVALVSAACSVTPRQILSPPALAHDGAVPAVPDVDLLALTPQMQAFLDRYILPYEYPDTRLDLLTLAVGPSGLLGYRYENEHSLPAGEAFAARAGNCLSFANMLVALARAAGLQAEYQEVLVQRDWSSHENMVLLAKHINVVITGRHVSYVVDITRQKLESDTDRRRLSDHEAVALYHNNLGVEALLQHELPSAHAHFVKAIETAPGMASPWVNLGVVLSRNGQFDDAAYAHRAALQLDPDETAALSNLYDVHLARGDAASAMLVEQKVERYRRQNPYYLLKLSDEALSETRYQDSLALLENAISKKRNDHRLHFALARTQYLTGQRAAAEDSYRRARELAPQTALAQYARPLLELIEESAAVRR
jgi:Flp pilus assembly protein TadD